MKPWARLLPKTRTGLICEISPCESQGALTIAATHGKMAYIPASTGDTLRPTSLADLNPDTWRPVTSQVLSAGLDYHYTVCGLAPAALSLYITPLFSATIGWRTMLLMMHRKVTEA